MLRWLRKLFSSPSPSEAARIMAVRAQDLRAAKIAKTTAELRAYVGDRTTGRKWLSV